jgi:imidazolonepropionase-like amidohydrolase
MKRITPASLLLGATLALSTSAIAEPLTATFGEGVAHAEPITAPAAAPAGEPGGPGLAIKTAKALTVPLEGKQFVDGAVILVKDGLIEAVGSAHETPIPVGYHILDVGDSWVSPGMVELHAHVAGTFDINDTVYLTNPGVRAAVSVRPGDRKMMMGLAGGVTTILFIPGSGANIGGHGVLLKTGLLDYESMLIRDPGSMKLAQAGNPERWTIRPGRTFMNWNTRNTLERGVAYAKRFAADVKNGIERPEKNLQFEVIRALHEGRAQISTHTQMYQVANMTLTMVADELGLPVFIDHGTFNAYGVAPRAKELGVSAILGPRNIDPPTASMMGWAGSNPERMQGVAAGYQERGLEMIGFNTDSPVIPQEELSLQAAIAVRYGFEDSELQTVRGLTIIPAKTANIDHLVGSIEVGKHADLLITTGDPVDPRSSVERIFTEGKTVYDTATERQRW